MAPTTPSQSGIFTIGPTDGNCLDVWSPPEMVENAHDQQNAPAVVYSAPLDNNITNAPSRAPDANR